MHATGIVGGIAGAVVALLGSLSAAPASHASNFGVELNGTYRAISDGEFAKVNDVFIDQATTVETWTISTTCLSPIECTGEIRSDAGWTATARLDDHWYIDREMPNWLPCPDGSTAAGHQKFIIWGFDSMRLERSNFNTDFLVGRNIGKSASGACGRNQPMVIELPIRLERIS